jgi:ABC-2 type transport system permease protein
VADVAAPGSFGEQVAIIAGLRWQVFRNSLRTTSARLDLLAFLMATVLGSLFVVGVGIGLGFACYFLVVEGHLELLALPMLAVFLFWQFLPLLLATSTTSFDFRSLLRFPLRYSVFFLLSLAYALFDPAALGSLLWLACIAAGIAWAQLDLLPWTLLVLAVYAGMNLILSRMVFSWLERLMARRRTREALAAIFLLCLLSFQLVSAFGSRWQRRLKPHARAALAALQPFPPGLAGRALAAGAEGNAPAALVSTGLLGAYALAFGHLLHRRLRAQYRGEDLGESPAATASPAAASAASFSSASSASFGSSFLPGPVAAVFDKELRYLYRNSMTALNLVLPLLLIILFSFTWSGPRRGAGLITRSPELAFPGAVAYMFLILAPFAHNSFAFDGRGIQLLLAAPVPFRAVLLGKNLLFGLIVAVETAVVWLMVSILFRPPGAWMALATIAGVLFALLIHFMVGNWLSLAFPRRFEFAQYRRRASGVSVLVGLLLQIALMGFFAIVFVLARGFRRAWLLPLILFILSAIALAAYRVTLERFTRFAAEKREVLTTQLCK